MGSQTVSQIPIIDFTDEKLKPGTDTWFSACQVVRSSLEGNVCFYAMNNKVPMELYNSVFALMKEVSDLPLETKRQITNDKPYHGYYERSPRAPLYESIGIDDPSNKEAVQKFTNIMWPTGYHQFCETLNLYAKLLVEMDQTAKRLPFDAYEVDKRHCDSLLESTNYILRSFKYHLPEKMENNLGLPSHTDNSYFTILHRYNVTGLQIRMKKKIGLMLIPYQVWSNDRIQACEHRVIMREEKERWSMGLFSFSSKMV